MDGGVNPGEARAGGFRGSLETDSAFQRGDVEGLGTKPLLAVRCGCVWNLSHFLDTFTWEPREKER